MSKHKKNASMGQMDRLMEEGVDLVITGRFGELEDKVKNPYALIAIAEEAMEILNLCIDDIEDWQLGILGEMCDAGDDGMDEDCTFDRFGTFMV